MKNFIANALHRIEHLYSITSSTWVPSHNARKTDIYKINMEKKEIDKRCFQTTYKLQIDLDKEHKKANELEQQITELHEMHEKDTLDLRNHKIWLEKENERQQSINEKNRERIEKLVQEKEKLKEEIEQDKLKN